MHGGRSARRAETRTTLSDGTRLEAASVVRSCWCNVGNVVLKVSPADPHHSGSSYNEIISNDKEKDEQ